MPLQAHYPVIDDRDADAIVSEIRARIPRYTSEWTDLNDSDLGMALVQLFAWMTDMLIYRLGQVPELNYLKFLELIGIELRPAEPARVEISFPLRSTATAATVAIPSRTQVQGEASADSGPIVFETERAIEAMRSRLASVQLLQGGSYLLLTALNESATEGFAPFGPQAANGNALLLGFSEELPFGAIDLALVVPDDTTSVAAYQCGIAASAAVSSSVVVWELWTGKQWQAVTMLEDEAVALTRSGHVVFTRPAGGVMQAAKIGRETATLFWLRARLESSAYDAAPRLLAIRTNTVAAVQAETIKDEVLGGSDSSPDQTFTLANSQVLAGSLQLEVDEGDGPQPWQEVEDFLGSERHARHFALDRSTGTITFGDGTRGAIPTANPNLPTSNVVAREYRICKGSAGNQAAGKVSKLVTTISGVDTAAVGNVQDAHSGRDEESVDEAKEGASAFLKARCRAVTAGDFEALAKQAGNVARAKALPRFHPDFPHTQIPGVVSVIVVPAVDDDPKPVPSEGTLATVCEYLDARRLLTTEVYVLRPTYRKVEIRGEIVATDSADLAEVKTAIDERLLAYLHPLLGGEDGRGWPFGGPIYYSRIHQQVFAVPGVDRITKLEVWLDGEEQPACTDVAIGARELVWSIGHGDIQVGYAR